MTEEQLTICEDAGGEFMVTPNVNPVLIRKCVAHGLVAMPGALTPSEAVEAFDAGAMYVKIFPAGSLGPGCIGAGVGGNLTNKEWISAGEWDKITAVAAALVKNAQL